VKNIGKKITETRVNVSVQICVMQGHYAEKRNAYRILVGKQEGKRPTGKTKTWVGGKY
jgi:hypothetical protein